LISASAPFPGLNPFREEDAPFFFGRDLERQLISANLIASRLTLLYGPSGVGKTSILNAGVKNYIIRERNRPASPDTPSKAVVVFRAWQSDPVQGLWKALDAEIGDGTKRPLRQCLQHVSIKQNRDVYVILDQFEEFFLYASSSSAHAEFAEELAGSVFSPDNRVNFLFSIREDAVARLDYFKGMIPRLFDNYLRIDHLSSQGAAAAIEGPLLKYSEIHPDRPVSVERPLMGEIVRQIAAAPAEVGVFGAGALAGGPAETRIQAPYLQIVLGRLWDEDSGAGRMRLATLRRLNGCAEILKNHLDRVLQGLSVPQRDLCCTLFHHLVTPSGAKIAHSIPDLAEYAHAAAAEVKTVVERLSSTETRILREIPASPGVSFTRYEIFHDALAPAVLNWRQRWQEDQMKQTQQLAFSAFEDAITSALPSAPSKVATLIRVHAQKAAATAGVTLSPGSLSGLRLLWVDDHRRTTHTKRDSCLRRGWTSWQ
jgi:hypothetical protein